VARKKDSSDLEASFFGDDNLDWLDDEEEAKPASPPPPAPEAPPEPTPVPEPVVAVAAAPAAPLPAPPAAPLPAPPAAPPPPPAPKFEATPVEPLAGSVSPTFDSSEMGFGTEEEAAASDEPAPAPPPGPPARLSVTPAPALRALPIADSSFTGSATWAEDGPVSTEMGENAGIDEPPPLSAPRLPLPVPEPVAPPPAPAIVVADEPPPVRSEPPRVERVVADVPAPVEAPPAPPPIVVAPVVRWAPEGAAQTARDTANALRAEAELREGSDRARLLVAAARIFRDDLGDQEAFGAALVEARASGAYNEQLLELLTEQAIATGAYDQALKLTIERAELLDGVSAAEALVDASTLARRQLPGRPGLERALDLLDQALARDPESFVAASALRDVVAALGRDDLRVGVLARIAGLTTGRSAAEARFEAGRSFDRMRRPGEAAHAWEQALAADPSHVPAFLALERARAMAGDDAALGAMYAAKADNSDGLDAAWWNTSAARHLSRVGQHDEAVRRYELGVRGGDPRAANELAALLLRIGRPADSVAVRLRGASGGQVAAAWLAVASAAELRNDADEALTAWSAVAAAAPGNLVAARAAAALLTGAGRLDDAAAVWRALAVDATPATEPEVFLHLALVTERCGALDESEIAWSRCAELWPGRRFVVDGRVRVALRQAGGARDAAVILEETARGADAGAAGALWFRAGRMRERAGDMAGAVVCYASARAAGAGEDVVIDAWIDAADVAGTGADARIAAADVATDAQARLELLEQAAWMLLAAGDTTRALDVFGRALGNGELLPASAVARADLLLRSGDAAAAVAASREIAMHTSDPASRAWGLVAVAGLSGALGANPLEDLLRVLARDPANEAARASIEATCIESGDSAALVEIYTMALPALTDPDARRAVGLKMVDLLVALGDADGAGASLRDLLDGAGALPFEALAYVAERVGRSAEAARAWAALGARGRVDHARLLALPEHAATASATLREALATPESRLAAAHGLARVGAAVNDPAALADAHAALAESESSAPVRFAHAAWTASLRQVAGDEQGALGAIHDALALRPDSRSAFEAARQLCLRAGDADALRRLFATYRPGNHLGLAEALDRLGGSAAAEAWSAAATADDSLAVLLPLERALSVAEDWKGMSSVIARTLDVARDPKNRARLIAKQRWLLAEKLAGSDMAWEHYTRLHEADPTDREVTETLARVAAARGDQALAVRYLRALADGAPTPADAARVQCRIGEVHELNGDHAAARQAYLDALDHIPDDAQALGGLRRLAEADADWSAVIAVLQRQAALVKGRDRSAILREIAGVTEAHLASSNVAMDAWRAVVEQDPRDEVALERLISLAEANGEWHVVHESALSLAAVRQGSARAASLVKVGRVCEDHLDREEATRHYEDALIADPGCFAAADRLRVLLARQRDWSGVVRALLVLAEHGPESDRAGHILEAARVEADLRHDRQAATSLYARVLRVDPDEPAALRFLAQHLYSAGRLDEALPMFERLEPRAFEGADLDDFDVRLEVSSFFFRFAELLRLGARPEDAVSRYERALELNPTHAPSLEAVGPLYIASKQWAKADGVYKRLLQLTGDLGSTERVATINAQLGLVERALGNQQKAYARFAKALQIDPNHIAALRGTALVLADRGDWYDLLNIYNNVIYHATAPADVIAAYMTKGMVLDRHLNRPAKAAEHYERSLMVDPAQPEALLRLAEIAARAGEMPEARGYAQRGLAVAGDDLELVGALELVLAASLVGAGDDGGVTAAVGRALAADPTHLAGLSADERAVGVLVPLVARRVWEIADARRG
jgi:tetratricopeptide (TPR) repeat protein